MSIKLPEPDAYGYYAVWAYNEFWWPMQGLEYFVRPFLFDEAFARFFHVEIRDCLRYLAVGLAQAWTLFKCYQCMCVLPW